MLTDCFYWVGNMSLAASLTGLLLMLIVRLFRIPARIRYPLWAVAAVRFLLPFGMGYRYSLMGLVKRFADWMVTVHPDGMPGGGTMLNMVGAAESYFPITYKTRMLTRFFTVSAIVWLTVMLLFLSVAICFYRRSLREVRDAGHVEGRVYVSDKLDSPAVFGIFRPRIILPDFMLREGEQRGDFYAKRLGEQRGDANARRPEQQRDDDFDVMQSEQIDDFLRLVLQHETVHIRRGDNFFRLLAAAICCIHWFNPLSWLFLKRFLEDMELSCDEAVLRKCGEEQKETYAEALLYYAEKKSVFASAFGGAKIKTRMVHILSYKRLTIVSAVALTVFTAVVMIILLTNPL